MLALNEIYWKNRYSISIYTLMFIPVVLAVLTRIVKHSVDFETACL